MSRYKKKELRIVPFSVRLSLSSQNPAREKGGGQLREARVYPISFQDRANNRARPYICKHARRMSLTSNKKSPSAHTEI